MLPTIAALVLAEAAPRLAEDGSECPSYRKELPLRCAWGYVHVALPGLTVPIGEVRSGYYETLRLGTTFGVGAGMFRAFGRFGVAAGLRFGYAYTRQRYTAFDSVDKDLFMGPELRLGGAMHRLFAFGLVRGGYSQRWHTDPTRLLDEGGPSSWLSGYLGLGAGLWGRLGTRFLLGGEVVFDLLFADSRLQQKPVTFSLGLGAWL